MADTTVKTWHLSVTELKIVLQGLCLLKAHDQNSELLDLMMVVVTHKIYDMDIKNG